MDNLCYRSQSTKPWLTVIMPVYRGERWIHEALASLVEQAEPGIEILVIDSSPDSATATIVQSFSDRLQLRFERSHLPSWQAKTNFAASLASADHLCWLHHDDIWLPNRSQAIRTWIDRSPTAALHLAPSAVIDETGRHLGVWKCPFRSEGELNHHQFLQRLLIQNFISAPAPVYRKDAWLGCGGLDEELWYTADWDVWLKLSEQGAVHYHDEVTTAFRVHGSSLTVTGSRNILDFREQMELVLVRHLSRLPGSDTRIERISRASIDLNCALAEASCGQWRSLLPALLGLFALGPRGISRYLRDSRLLDRVTPRFKAKLMGHF